MQTKLYIYTWHIYTQYLNIQEHVYESWPCHWERFWWTRQSYGTDTQSTEPTAAALLQKVCWGVVPDWSVAQVQLCEASVCRLLVNPYYASFPASRQAFRQIKISDKKIEESGVRDIPFFRGPYEEEGAQNLKRIKQIWGELYFPQLRQLRQVTWGLTSADVRLTSGLTWQLRLSGALRCPLFCPTVTNLVLSENDVCVRITLTQEVDCYQRRCDLFYAAVVVLPYNPVSCIML